MTEEQYRKRARTILARIIELQRLAALSTPEEWSEEQHEEETEALHTARWAMFDVAYPA